MFDSIIGNLTKYQTLVVTLDVAVFMQLIGLFFVVLIDRYISRMHRRLFLIIDILLTVIVLENQFGELLDYSKTPYVIWIFINILGYIIRPIVIMLLIKVAAPPTKGPKITAPTTSVAFPSHIESSFANNEFEKSSMVDKDAIIRICMIRL